MKTEKEFKSMLNELFTLVPNPETGKPYTNQEVADECSGITASHLARLRRGDSSNPRYSLILALSRFFKVQPSYFFPVVGDGIHRSLPDVMQVVDPKTGETMGEVVFRSVRSTTSIDSDSTEEK